MARRKNGNDDPDKETPEQPEPEPVPAGAAPMADVEHIDYFALVPQAGQIERLLKPLLSAAAILPLAAQAQQNMQRYLEIERQAREQADVQVARRNLAQTQAEQIEVENQNIRTQIVQQAQDEARGKALEAGEAELARVRAGAEPIMAEIQQLTTQRDTLHDTVVELQQAAATLQTEVRALTESRNQLRDRVQAIAMAAGVSDE